MTDLDLLRRYAHCGDERAFAELVGRHIDMVYAACLRQLRNRHDAEDVAQTVFIALASKASSLPEGTVMAGWLYRAAVYISKDLRRTARRRKLRESVAAARREARRSGSDPPAPDLDGALGRLNTDDRHAIVLRYLESRSFREVADELQVTEEAARKRVNRALEKVRGTLAASGESVLSLIAVEQVLRASIHPAPPGLLASATHSALTGNAITSGGAGFWKGAAATIMAATHVKLLAGTAVLALLVSGAFVGYKRISRPTAATVVLTSHSEPLTVILPLEADWKKQFIDTYALAPGQIVKQIEHVPVQERQQYWATLPNRPPFKLTPESTLVFRSNGSDLHWTQITPGWIPLEWAIGFGAGLKGWQVDRSIPQDMKFTGDWVFRENATPQQVMDAMANLVSERLGRQVRFVKRAVVRDVLIARGTYKFVPLQGYPNDNVIQLTDSPGKTAGARFTFDGKVVDLLDRVSMVKAMQVIDQTGSSETRIKMCDQSNWHDADALVRTIAAQSSIHFDREPRQIEMWFMVGSDGTTLPASPH